MVTVPIIDAHVHLWDPASLRIPWLDDLPALNRAFTLTDYRRDTSAVAIESMVYVEVAAAPEYGLAEARRAARYATQEPRLRGIVATAPIEHGERMRSYLEALVAIDPRIRIVRRNIQAITDPEWCLQAAFVRGVELLGEYGLSFELCIRHEQLSAVSELARRCPTTPLMLDHLGKPPIREKVLEPWAAHLRSLAASPQVMCKLSGAVTEADHLNWSPADLAPYIAHALEMFGEDRVVFGSDWPVMLLATTYGRWIETLDALTVELSEAARRKLWAENARRFYCLETATIEERR